jgi:hypothetical protein
MTKATEGRGVDVGLLVHHEGVRVYRFYDAGRYHYYAVGGDVPAGTFASWSETCGKNCNRTIVYEISTVAVR